ncbi:hypothetical protein NDU88_002908 [Pleurodeles waltl]|uniref:Uncharacterized protein n=1 Tax=Pleurodeles waltl TaxID=8319 RepID=A0AAV7T3A1_PLEWA|nr:hypothetical protein NDU88_002908 [Pleurodeles waltl]
MQLEGRSWLGNEVAGGAPSVGVIPPLQLKWLNLQQLPGKRRRGRLPHGAACSLAAALAAGPTRAGPERTRNLQWAGTHLGNTPGGPIGGRLRPWPPCAASSPLRLWLADALRGPVPARPGCWSGRTDCSGRCRPEGPFLGSEPVIFVPAVAADAYWCRGAVRRSGRTVAPGWCCLTRRPAAGTLLASGWTGLAQCGAWSCRLVRFGRWCPGPGRWRTLGLQHLLAVTVVGLHVVWSLLCGLDNAVNAR